MSLRQNDITQLHVAGQCADLVATAEGEAHAHGLTTFPYVLPFPLQDILMKFFYLGECLHFQLMYMQHKLSRK